MESAQLKIFKVWLTVELTRRCKRSGAVNCYLPISQSESLSLILLDRSVLISPIAPSRMFVSTTARRAILIRLACFKPDEMKSSSFSDISSSKSGTSCESCEEIMQINQSPCGPGPFESPMRGATFLWLGSFEGI